MCRGGVVAFLGADAQPAAAARGETDDAVPLRVAGVVRRTAAACESSK